MSALLFTGPSIQISVAEERSKSEQLNNLNAGISRLSPSILTRMSWRARQPLPGMKAQDIVGIILHHTGVRRNYKTPLESKMLNLQSFSQRPDQVSPGHWKPVWPDVPYHFYVDSTGHIAEGRDVHFAGDTNTNYDTSGFIQVVVEGDFEDETPSVKQLMALRELLVWLTITWHVSMPHIGVHQQYAPTDCPGRNLLASLPVLLKRVAEERGKIIN
jgi:N-acetylmuramoyl-L-alanine amidase